MAADFYPEGTTAMPFDDPQRSLVKIVALGVGGGGGGGTNLTGHGNPNGVVTGTAGQIYTDQDTDQLWISHGGTVWGP